MGGLYEFHTKLYNRLLDRLRIEADRYEREDAFSGIMEDIRGGRDMKEAYKDAFSLVHAADLDDALYESCLAEAA